MRAFQPICCKVKWCKQLPRDMAFSMRIRQQISMQINLEGLFIRLVLLSILPYRTLVVVLTEEFMTPLKMPWGLLEIKCSPSDYLSDLNYLKHNGRTGAYSLKKTHAYYYQIMGCVGLTGSAWEDFFVFCRSEFHCERIYFDATFFSEMLEKLNLFYFDILLTASVQ